MRVVDIDRIGDATTPFPVDEAWVLDPAARSPRSTTPTSLPLEGRPQLVVRPGPLVELETDVARNRADGGPRIVRLCPGPADHDYPLEPWVLSPLLEYCDSEAIAVLIDPGPSPAAYPWTGIVRLAHDHPSLVVVALAAPLGRPTAARALDVAPNLILEATGVGDGAGDELRRLVEMAGAYRFVYGSGDRTVLPSVVAAALSEDDAAVVLSGTAERIDAGMWASTYL